jgi:hypothetical protein
VKKPTQKEGSKQANIYIVRMRLAKKTLETQVSELKIYEIEDLDVDILFLFLFKFSLYSQ